MNPKNYEPGMRITFDARSKTAAVAFRGRVITLPDQFTSEHEAVSAAENYCRKHGWVDKPVPAIPARSLLKHRRSSSL